MAFIIVILLFLFCNVPYSSAELYKWVDGKGVVHFTDDLMQIPDEYRHEAERREVPEEDVPVVNKKVENQQASKEPQDDYKDRLGRGEAYWKGRIDECQIKLKDYQDRIRGLREKYNDFTEKYNQSKSSAERANLRKERELVKEEMDKFKTLAEETKTILDQKIPEEAQIYKAKPEWIKQ